MGFELNASFWRGLGLVTCFKAFTPVRLEIEEQLQLQASTEQAALLQHCSD